MVNCSPNTNNNFVLDNVVEQLQKDRQTSKSSEGELIHETAAAAIMDSDMDDIEILKEKINCTSTASMVHDESSKQEMEKNNNRHHIEGVDGESEEGGGEGEEEEGGVNSGEHEGCIRVGREYQATMPAYINIEQRRPELCPERALLIWSPNSDIHRDKLEEYIHLSKSKYGYNTEQALGMLFWHKHDLDKSIKDLSNFTPFPDDWSLEDRVLFEQAFQFHGKSFHRIRQMLPDKSIAQLVKYYYDWKKTRARISLMDKQAKAIQHQKVSSSTNSTKSSKITSNNTSTVPQDVKTDKKEEIQSRKEEENDESIKIESTEIVKSEESQKFDSKNVSDQVMKDNENIINEYKTRSGSISNIVQPIFVHDFKEPVRPHCFNCEIECHVTHSTAKGELCGTCHSHFLKTSQLRPTSVKNVNTNQQNLNNQRKKDSLSKIKFHQNRSSLKINNSNKKDGSGVGEEEGGPPSGIHINHDDLLTIASGSTSAQNLLHSLDMDIISSKRTVQLNKQSLSNLESKDNLLEVDGLPDDLQSGCIPPVSGRWTEEEIELIIEGVRHFGRDYKSISNVIGSKTETHVRNYFISNRSKNQLLDQSVREFDKSSSSPSKNSGV